MDIDQSKENIQPLRGGRNVHQLGTALQAQSDVDAQRQLLLQKEEHEALIANYEGPDPLDAWFNYIQWVEQCFPKHGHEGHIVQIIKECLYRFEKDERYFQDRRFVKLWIKYIDCLTNPLEIYQKLYSTGIGIQCAELYRAWACYCVESGDYKKANQVYILGLQTNAQPIEELKEAHTNFHIFYAQRMLHSDDSPTKRKADSALAETRMALTSLRTFKRRNIANAPIQRTGDNIRNPLPGVMRQQITGANENRTGASNIMVNIYEDMPSTSQTSVPIAEVETTPSSVLQIFSNMENEKEVGMWTNSRVSKGSQPTVPHQPLPFTPYEDEGQLLLGPNHLPYCAEDLNSSIALCVPDPPDPSKIPCYDKKYVYVDNTEYSLEEIRARKFTLQQVACPPKSIESATTSNMQTPATSSPGSQYMYRPRQTMTLASMTSDNDQLEQFIPLSIPAVQNVTDVQNVESPSEPQVLVNLDSNEYNSTNMPNTMSLGPATSTAVPPTSSHIANLNTSHSCPDRYKLNESRVVSNGCDAANNLDNSLKNFDPPIDDYNRSLIENMHTDSITVNTKEARWELRNLFNDNEPSIVQPVVPQFDASQFNIHEDCSMTIALKKKSLGPSQRMEEMPQMATPEDKENGPQSHRIYTMPANPTSNATVIEEVTSTQTFNFNLKTSSTPNIAQFKKPQVFTDISAKTGAIKKLMTEESAADVAGAGDHTSAHSLHLSEEALQTFNTDTSPNKVLSAIIEESYSKSSSSSGSVQQTRNMTMYNNKDVHVHGHYEQPQAGGGYESPAHAQPRLANGQFARALPPHHSAPPLQNQPYVDIDHHYQKNANRFTAQRAVHAHAYRPAYPPTEAAYRVPSYPSVSSAQPSFSAAQREFTGSTAITYASPHHVTTPGVRDPALQSPLRTSAEYAATQATYSGAQFGYGAPVSDDRLVYPSNSRSEYVPVQSGYPSSSGCTPHSPFQSPPHRSPGYVQQFRSYPHDATYGTPSRIHTQQESQHIRPATYSSNHSFHSPNYAMHVGTAGSSNLNKSENQNYNSYYNSMHQAQYRTYQSPAPSQLQHSQFGNSMSVQQNTQAMQTPPSKPRTLQASPSESYTNQIDYQQNSYLHHQNDVHQHSTNREVVYPPEAEEQGPMPQNPTPSSATYKSPSVLRSVRHEQQHKSGPQHSATLPEGGYSNQFLNFISLRNEPKDDAHMPKFTNSPSISQKMHKNLYVSSPEPMAATITSTEAKGTTVSNNATPIQSAKVTTTQQKEISKRQLDFDHRIEFQSEDSRDSLSKESRISSVRSRQSLQSEGFGMDVDNENSMECHTFKSTCANSALETKDVPRPAAVDFPDVINPFNNELCNSLLQYVKFPNKTHCDGYVEVRSVPKLQQGITLSVGTGRYSIEKQLGKGTYGSVFASLDLQNNKLVALKYQKPGHPWEFYICKEIKARIKDPFMLPGYMDVSVAYFGDSASIFVSELSKYGSLLDVANKIKVATTKPIHESIVMLLTTEMLSILHYLHKAEIIHADMKPDNFLLMKIPTSEWRTPSLQLIDLGCAIDMSLFPAGTSFKKIVSTEGFTCTEMRERRSWTYQTDLYCLAGTIHVILLGNYMKTVNKLGQCNIDKKLPRYIQGSLWDKVFTTLLNVPDCQSFPDLMDLKNDLEMYCSKDDNLSSQLRRFANILKSR